MAHCEHTIPAFFPTNAHTLILGSFPSVKSRECGFYYGHPQNRFWRVLADVTNSTLPNTINEKKELLKSNGIVLWDVIAECEIIGSADSSIKNVIVNPIADAIKTHGIKRIFLNGRTSERLFKQYIKDESDIKAVALPSTSPANAAWSLERLVEAWKILL